jgi:hypothetical protein
MGIVKNLFGKTTVYKKWQDKKIASFKKEQELNEKLLIPERKKFYQQFINAGDLVFDVGANEGNRVQVFLDLNANVVAVEPQPNCIEILKQNENIEFIPITNLTREQLSDIISVSKVYIDFGEHPGKDRIPRECAVGGCVVIVGTQNSGGNHIDVPIDQKFEYNIKDNSYDYHEIANFIEDAICNYSYFFDIQKNYRDIIRKEKQTFFDEIKYMIELQKK